MHNFCGFSHCFSAHFISFERASELAPKTTEVLWCNATSRQTPPLPPPFPLALCCISHIGGDEHSPSLTVWGKMLCEAPPVAAWEGRQGAEAAAVDNCPTLTDRMYFAPGPGACDKQM